MISAISFWYNMNLLMIQNKNNPFKLSHCQNTFVLRKFDYIIYIHFH